MLFPYQIPVWEWWLMWLNLLKSYFSAAFGGRKILGFETLKTVDSPCKIAFWDPKIPDFSRPPEAAGKFCQIWVILMKPRGVYWVGGYQCFFFRLKRKKIQIFSFWENLDLQFRKYFQKIWDFFQGINENEAKIRFGEVKMANFSPAACSKSNFL